MRKIILAIVALVVTTLTPSVASAQSLQDILGVVQAGSAYGYNSCSYVTSGFGKVACQANRASTVASTLVEIKRRRDYERRAEFDRRTQQLTALQRACQAGDQQSCLRSGGSDPRQMEVARALMDACTAGDRSSCARAESMMDERNIVAASYQNQGYRQAPAYQTPRQQVAQCLPVYDSRTGYRIAGACR